MTKRISVEISDSAYAALSKIAKIGGNSLRDEASFYLEGVASGPVGHLLEFFSTDPDFCERQFFKHVMQDQIKTMSEAIMVAATMTLHHGQRFAVSTDIHVDEASSGLNRGPLQ